MNRARTPRRTTSPRTARGAALLVGLLILVLITIVALLAARLSTLQSRAASAQRATGMSFAQAEGALVAAERWLASRETGQPCLGIAPSDVAWVADDARRARFVARDAWPDAIGTAFPVDDDEASRPARDARVLIEAIAFVDDAVRDAPDAAGGAATPVARATAFSCDAAAPDGVVWFRLTARGTGREPLVDGYPPASSVVESYFSVRIRGAAPVDAPEPRRGAWRVID